MNNTPQFGPRGFGGGSGFGPVHGYYHSGPPTLAWVTFALVLLLVLTVFALLVARFASGGRGRGRGHFGPRMRMRGGSPDPLDILRMRFASGQISREEYLQATSDLTPGPQPPPAAAT